MNISLVPPEKTARILGVNQVTLDEWNRLNILKPSMTLDGQLGYRQDQISQFLNLQKIDIKNANHFIPFVAFVLSFVTTTLITQIVLLKTSVQKPHPVSSVLTTNASQSEVPLVDQDFDLGKVQDVTTSNLSYSQTYNSVFDPEGNIKEDSSTSNVLASSVFINPVIPDTLQISSPIHPLFFVLVLIICSLILFYIYKDQPKPTSSLNRLSTSDYKVIELNQKTDGSIVLIYQDHEFKVSKPELDSESDQFIERLMESVTPDTKEFDYDSSKDIQVCLNAPLSKLVTRLGFVGLKRDLFFPRTSKNRVLFRKFVTESDLASMNISRGQLLRELSLVD